MTGCVLCGRSQVSRRVDLTYGEIGQADPSDYTILSVLRGVTMCSECFIGRPVADLVNLNAGEVGIVRGCLVQCTGHAPWWLRIALPNGAYRWGKVVCPSCHGRASTQFITEAVKKEPNRFWQAVRDAFAVLDWRDTGEEWEEGEDDAMGSGGDPGPVAGVEDDVLASDVELAEEPEGPEGTPRSGDPARELQAN